MAKDKKQKKDNSEQRASNPETQEQLEELRSDLQRTRADFENYRRRTEQDLQRARAAGMSGTILKLLPVIDNIERAIAHMPERLKEDKWAQGVTGLVRHLEKSLESLDVYRIDAKSGTPFNPELHEAVMAIEGDGDEVISEELQAGYKQGDRIIRHSMVKVKR